MRDRLIELIDNSNCVDNWDYYTDDFKEPNPIEQLADYLLEKGVVVPMCKMGDEIYRISDGKIYNLWQVKSFEVYGDEIVYFDDSDNGFVASDIGETIFLTKEEAEKALKGGAEE